MSAFDQYVVLAILTWPSLLIAVLLTAGYIVHLEMKVDRLHATPEPSTTDLAAGCDALGQCSRYLTTDLADASPAGKDGYR